MSVKAVLQFSFVVIDQYLFVALSIGDLCDFILIFWQVSL